MGEQAPEWRHIGAIPMPTLSIKNVPERLLSKLRQRAAQHHRSIQGELMALLSAAVEEGSNDSKLAASAKQGPTIDGPLARRGGTRRIEDIVAEHRKRQKQPSKQSPLAVDLIRSDRDAR
jgi:plasmid stability protein